MAAFLGKLRRGAGRLVRRAAPVLRKVARVAGHVVGAAAVIGVGVAMVRRVGGGRGEGPGWDIPRGI